MLLNYNKPVDFSNEKSLRQFRRWLSEKLAEYHSCIEYRKETDKFFKFPEERPITCDYREARDYINLVDHFHKTITKIINKKFTHASEPANH